MPMFGIPDISQLSRVCSTIDRLLERIPQEEMIARYRSPEGLRIRVVIEETEIIAQIRERKPTAEMIADGR